MKKRLTAIGWAFSLAWKIDKKLLIFWFSLVSLVSVLPSVTLYFKNEMIAILDAFVLSGVGEVKDILPTIITYGIIMALIGISNRLNVEFIYSVMYDKYMFGMSELLMDSVQDFSMEELLSKKLNDEYYAVVLREGALTDVISGICSLAGKFVGLISLLIVSISISMPIFFFSLIYIIGIVWLNMVFVEKQRYGRLKIRDSERLAGHYEEMPFSADYAKELRVFELKENLVHNWENAYKPIYDFEVKNCFDIELKNFISNFVFYIFVIVMTVISLFSVANGSMETADLLVAFLMCLDIYASVSGVARMLRLTDHGIYAIERQHRIFGLRAKKEEILQKTENAKNDDIVFEAENVSYAYGGDKLALDHVSLKIRKGENIALVGVNGSGKSTLVKLLLKLYKPMSGKLYFNGEDYENLEQDVFNDKIGAFFQDFFLFHMPIGENVGFGDVKNIKDEKRIEEALQKGGADSIVKRLNKGKDTFIYKNIEETGVDFSGGEKQKIAISRTHMSDKDILIFDEPASALDPIAELEQFMNIKSKITGCTSILVSHRVGFARLADRIILMDGGKIAEMGTHEELMNRNGKYAELFNAQAQWYS